MMKYDLEKFINATLFFAKKVKKLGITKLNKLLYYSDFEHYRLYGRPIIGDVYIRMEQGPVPKESYSIFTAFRSGADNYLQKVIYLRPELVSSLNSNPVKRDTIVPKPKSKVNLSIFSKSEIEVMEKMAFVWKGATAKTASEQSHLEKPWKETKSGIIDYKLALEQSDAISRDYAEYREEEDRLLESLLSER